MKKITILLLMLCTFMGISAANTSEYEPCEKDADGSWLIKNKSNLLYFAEQMAKGYKYNARLTADIDMGDDQTMIGTSTWPYKGVFDGNGHTITVAYNVSEDYVALFRYATKATIKRLKVSGSITSSARYAASFIGFAKECIVTQCLSDVTITSTYSGEAYNAGFVGRTDRIESISSGQNTISQCMFTGSLKGENATRCSGFVAEANDDVDILRCLFAPSEVTCSSTNACTFVYSYNEKFISVNNGYYTTALGKTQGKATNLDEIKSGAICYILNSTVSDGTQAWYQTLKSDDYPVLDNTHGTVYSGKDICPQSSTASYSNTTHTSDDTFDAEGYAHCTHCEMETPQPASLDTDGYYIIANAGQFEWFARSVPTNTTVINGRLTKDINLGNRNVMIGSSDFSFRGTFDGAKHSITVAYDVTEDYAAPFRDISGAVIKDLTTLGTITTTKKFAAGIAARASKATISNCQSGVTIQANYESATDGTHGGIVANIPEYTTLKDVLFYGKLLGENATNCGGVIGWINYDGKTENILFAPEEITFNPSGFEVMGRGNWDNWLVEKKNCFYTVKYGNLQGSYASPTDLSCGRTCYSLENGNLTNPLWRQTIGIDERPLLHSDHDIVYAQDDHYGYNDVFVNTPYTSHAVQGDYDGQGLGECEVCGRTIYEPATKHGKYKTYDLKNRGNFVWLSKQMAYTNLDVDSINIVADIDLKSSQEMLGTSYNMIGRDCSNGANIDGHYHTLKINYTATDDVCAPFRFVKYGKVSNIRVSGYIDTDYERAGGVIGQVGEDDIDWIVEEVTCTNVVSDVDITGNQKTEGFYWYGGIIGFSAKKADFLNCAFTGSVRSINCYGVNGMAGGAHFVQGSRFTEINSTNCYCYPERIEGYEHKYIISGSTGYHIYTGFFKNYEKVGTCTNDYWCYTPLSTYPVIQTYGATEKSKTQMHDGSLLSSLGDAWGQNIAMHELPMPWYTDLTVKKNSYIFDDKREYSSNEEYVINKLGYYRDFNGKWEALYVPFALNIGELIDDYDIATINGVRQQDTDGDGVIDYSVMDIVVQKEGCTQPNMPYLIRAKNSGLVFISHENDCNVKPAHVNDIECSTTVTDYTIRGTYQGVTYEDAEGLYSINDEGVLERCTRHDVIDPQRWYIKATPRTGSGSYNETEVTASAAKMFINVLGEDMPTGVSSHNSDTHSMDSDALYNIAGQRVSKDTKGMVIKNGKVIYQH